MFCRNCGTKLEEGAAFCHNCGTPIEKAVPEVKEKKVERKEQKTEDIPVKQESNREKSRNHISGKKKNYNRQLAMIIAAAVLVIVVVLAVVIPKTKKADTKKNSKKESAVTDDIKEGSIDWKQAYRDFFEQDEQKILSCKLIEVEALDYPMLVYEADEGSLKYELLYVTRDGAVESVICYSNTTEVYYSQEGSVFAEASMGMDEKSFWTQEYDSETDKFVEVKKGTAVLDKEYYEETYALRYEYTINGEACEEPEYELYVEEMKRDEDYNYIEFGQDENRSIEELLDSYGKDSDKKDQASDEEDVELDTDWDRLDSYIEEVVLPAYKTYISENYGNGDLDIYSLLCVDSDDNIPELLFDNSGDGRGTVLLSYDNITGIVHESKASCRGYDFMYEPNQNYVVFCYAGNGLEEHTVAHMEDHELVVDQTLSCLWIGDDTELKVNGKECSNQVYNEARANALDKRALTGGWNEFATIEEAYEKFGYMEFSFFCDEISKFEKNGEQLTIQINNGSALNFTVPESLEWEYGGYGENGLVIDGYWEENELEEYISEIRAEGEKFGYVDSPGTLRLEVQDNVVVRLYVIFS